MQQVYFAQGQGTSSPVTANGQGGDFELATGPVPAGSYTAEAQISAYDAESHLRCILQDTTFRQLEPADDNPTAPAGQHFTIFNTLEMTAAFTKTDDLPVHLDCLTEDTTPGLTTKLDANLLVTKVASVN
jgi:hypothetical protein